MDDPAFSPTAVAVNVAKSQQIVSFRDSFVQKNVGPETALVNYR